MPPSLEFPIGIICQIALENGFNHRSSPGFWSLITEPPGFFTLLQDFPRPFLHPSPGFSIVLNPPVRKINAISHYFSVFLLITLFCILKYLNRESKVIFMQEFEISLFQFSNSMSTDKRQFSFKNILKRFAKRLWLLNMLGKLIVL
jgi:hypothetical protein